jgi:hypothetical protein
MPGFVQTRIQDLVGEVFEPADLSASTMTPTLKARSASFLLLAHAEIEFALEIECRRTANLLRSSVAPATAILAWGLFIATSDSTNKKKPPLEWIVDQYDHIVHQNHGIKEANLKILLSPLGVDMNIAKVDVSTLNTFGARRGDLAHQPLVNWNTSDLPSVHVTSGVQAGLAADQIIDLIKTKHSLISHAGQSRGLMRRIRRSVAEMLRSGAMLVDSD